MTEGSSVVGDATNVHTRTGSCHCGAVAFEAEMSLEGLIECNCSWCGRTGNILAFVASAAFRQTAGEDSQTSYRFNTQVINHLFCRTCGVASFGRGTGPDGQEMVAINARCLEGVDPWSLKAERFDGAKL